MSGKGSGRRKVNKVKSGSFNIKIGVEKNIDLDKFAIEWSNLTLDAAADLARETAIELVRKDNGDLADSIRRFPESAPSKGKVIIQTSQVYALAQEYGRIDNPTGSVAADPSEPKSGKGGPYTFNPFMRPAIAFVKSKIREIAASVKELAIRRSKLK